MNKDLIIEKLKEFNYPEQMFGSVVGKIDRFDYDLSYDFDMWLENGKAPSVQYEGYTFNDLTEEYSFNPINAFITLDWLKREPEEAIKALERGIK